VVYHIPLLVLTKAAGSGLANGSQTSKVRTEADETVSTTTSSYDLRNRLPEVATATVPGSGPTVTDTATYTYDDEGNRVAVHEVQTSGGTTTADVTTRYNQDVAGGLSQVIEEYTGTNTTPGMSYVEGDLMLGQAAGTAFGWFLVDGQMSTRQVADGSGAVTARLAYDGFGNAVGTRSGATAYQYTNQRFDAAAGGYDLRARVYDAGTGRFTSSDPFPGWLDKPLSLHDYSYCWNDPIDWCDPTGYAPNFFTAGYLAYAEAEAQVALAGMAAVATSIQNAANPEQALIVMAGAAGAVMNLTVAGVNLTEAWSAFVQGRPAVHAEKQQSLRSKYGKPGGAEHKGGNNWDKHSKRDLGRGGEKGDWNRSPPLQRPQGHSGPWPPPQQGSPSYSFKINGRDQYGLTFPMGGRLRIR
jgi:RHS repeat-associated protein